MKHYVTPPVGWYALAHRLKGGCTAHKIYLEQQYIFRSHKIYSGAENIFRSTKYIEGHNIYASVQSIFRGTEYIQEHNVYLGDKIY